MRHRCQEIGSHSLDPQADCVSLLRLLSPQRPSPRNLLGVAGGEIIFQALQGWGFERYQEEKRGMCEGC